MRKPTNEQFDVAIMWLQNNEGDGDEGEACKAVAEWLDHLMSEDWLRSQAREAGVTVATLRRKLAEQAKTRPTP